MKNNELHAQIATVLELARENMMTKGWSKKNDKMIRGVIDDLMFIHRRYTATFESRKNKKI